LCSTARQKRLRSECVQGRIHADVLRVQLPTSGGGYPVLGGFETRGETVGVEPRPQPHRQWQQLGIWQYDHGTRGMGLKGLQLGVNTWKQAQAIG
jgi:hypothetical protein